MNIEGEIWKAINTPYKVFNDAYEISNMGRLRNKKILNILCTTIYKNVESIALKDRANKISYTPTIHRLVAFAFLPYTGNQDDYKVNHIDNNTIHNVLSNLEILTQMEISQKHSAKPVLSLDKNNKYTIYGSEREAAEKLSTKAKLISGAIHNNYYTSECKWFLLNSDEAREIIQKYEST
jgi:hypothetical protein